MALQLNNDGAAELIDADGAVRAVSDPASSDAGSFKFEAAPDQTLYLCLGVSDGGDMSMLWNDSVGDLTGVASPASWQIRSCLSSRSAATEMERALCVFPSTMSEPSAAARAAHG